MDLNRRLFQLVGAMALLLPASGMADALLASASSGAWQARIVTTVSASKLQLWQSVAAGSAPARLILENSVFLPPGLGNVSGGIRLLDLRIAGDRLEISIQDRPPASLAYMQRDFSFDLSKPRFPLSYFRTVTYREETAGWLEVDFEKARAKQCNEVPSVNLTQCEPRAVKLQDQFLAPFLTDIGDAFSYSAPLLLRLVY
ncbi:MAG: hypothetical protein ACOYNZ_02760 [Rhodoferax sp.]